MKLKLVSSKGKEVNDMKLTRFQKGMGGLLVVSLIAGSLPGMVKADSYKTNRTLAILQEIDKNTDSVKSNYFIKDKLAYQDFTEQTTIDTENQAVIVDLTEGTILAGAHLKELMNTSEHIRLLTTLI